MFWTNQARQRERTRGKGRARLDGSHRKPRQRQRRTPRGHLGGESCGSERSGRDLKSHVKQGIGAGRDRRA